MSLFGGGRRSPKERSAEERRQAMIERERRRLGDPGWEPPAGHPLAPGAASKRAKPSVDRPDAEAHADADVGVEDVHDDLLGEELWVDERPQAPTAWPPPPPGAIPPPARPAPAERDPARADFAPREPARAAREPEQPRRIEPDPPAQPLAEAYELPDHRQVALHRRRGARTIVSPPGDGTMGGTIPGPSKVGWIVGGVALVLIALIAWSQWLLWQPGKGDGTGEITVEIAEGSTANQVASQLEDAGVIDSARLFGIRALLAGKREDLSAGELTLKRDMSYGAALAALSGTSARPVDLTQVTVPEGLSIRETARRLKRRGIVDDYGATAKRIFDEQRARLRTRYRMPSDVDSLEGFLFPATYELPVGFSARELIERQLQTFDQNFSTISMARASRANLTPYDVITVASLVEREARLSRERPLISAVIWNRLEEDMPLGIDATFRYASDDWQNPILQSELETDGPYNSRLRTGLPPTPIGNPGLSSLEAAADPADRDFLYFVVKPGRCGEHAFSSTIEKFTEDTAKYNAARDAQGGSPVTC